MRYGSRLDVRIEDRVYRALEARALQEDRELPDIVRRILRDALLLTGSNEALAQAYSETPGASTVDTE